ncbi:MAG TPA: flagellar hook-associated protein FlgK [Steroidobacteraceae bacterium]|nr:flagellar hook-associated protein FlgK [Steroidobacteraceae bacterium]
MNTAVSGLIAFQRALAVTGNNISNANTVGYSRQTANLADRNPDATAGIFIGNGVDVTSVSRAYDQFAVDQLRAGNGVLGQQTSFLNVANQVDNLLSGSTNGVSAGITSFFNAWQTLSSDPSSASNRQQIISQAQGLASSISQTATQLDTLQGNINQQLNTTVGTINSLAASIAKLNAQIATQTAEAGGQPPNDLLDQRDQLVTQLSSLVSVKSNVEQDGSVDLFVGNGQALVVRNQSTTLGTASNSYDASQLDITYGKGAGQQVITSAISGGQLGGLLQATSQMIEPALNGLGQLATAIAAQVNTQQQLGLDQNGQLGKPLLNVALPAVFSDSTNGGSGTLTATSVSVGALTTNDYLLRYSGGAWTATINGTGQTVAVSGAGTAGNPLVVGGVSLVVGGAPANGDTFLVKPTANAARTISTAFSDPRLIAAASPVQSAAALSNVGNATIGPATPMTSVPVSSTPLPPNAALLTPASIVFQNPPTSYTINGGAPQAYNSGQPITANGWTVTITGVPSAGDTFTVGPNTSGGGDNRNALAMAQLQNQGVLVGGTVGLGAGYSTLVGVIGTLTQQANTAQTAQQAVVNQAQQQVSSVSGVNLDEEAANMLRWQQAYAAAAKVVTTADTMFQTLLTAIHG